jgi:hypothetical protein
LGIYQYLLLLKWAKIVFDHLSQSFANVFRFHEKSPQGNILILSPISRKHNKIDRHRLRSKMHLISAAENNAWRLGYDIILIRLLIYFSALVSIALPEIHFNRVSKAAYSPMKNLLQDLWNREETKIVLVLAVALALSALFFGWGTGEQPIQPGGKLKGEAFRYDYNW